MIIRQCVGWKVLIDPETQALSWPPTLQQALTIMPAVQSSYVIFYRRFLRRLEKKWETMATRPSALPGTNGAPAPVQDALPIADFDDDLGVGLDVDDAEAGADVRNDVNAGINERHAANGLWTLNFLAGALVWPGVCYGMGELMRFLLPKFLVSKPARGPYTGILQERWGRSLVGGCLFVVLKDAFSLYVKYRRAMDKPHRRIKNVDRRNRK